MVGRAWVMPGSCLQSPGAEAEALTMRRVFQAVLGDEPQGLRLLKQPRSEGYAFYNYPIHHDQAILPPDLASLLYRGEKVLSTPAESKIMLQLRSYLLA